VTVGVSFVTSFARLAELHDLAVAALRGEKKNQKSRPSSRSGEQREQALEEGGARDDVVEAVLRGRGIDRRDDLGRARRRSRTAPGGALERRDSVMSTRWSPSVFVTW
jgi:hypothetical protein